MPDMPSDRMYTRDHEWILNENSSLLIGITDYAQSAMGDIVFVDFPQANAFMAKGGELLTLESIKSVSPVYAPFDGTVVDINRALEDSPEIINQDPYGAWMVRLSVENYDASGLMDAAAYGAFCAGGA
jgi:glycine cleavage system H protein